jgi:hypothetical protein
LYFEANPAMRPQICTPGVAPVRHVLMDHDRTAEEWRHFIEPKKEDKSCSNRDGWA